jgi:hypothetical protein
MSRRASAIALVVVLGAAAAVAIGYLHGLGPLSVASAGPPGRLPATPRVVDHACAAHIDGWDQAGARPYFWVGVDEGPESVTAVWWPTTNESECRVTQSRGDAAVATALANDIRRSEGVPSGAGNCPTDAGAVDLYFAYAGGHWERVRAYPNGCTRVTAHGRRARRAVLSADLSAIAPPGEWRQLLR